MTDFVFSAEGPTKDGSSAGGKRARTQEVLIVDELDSELPPPPLPPIPMSFKDKVAGDFGMAEEQMDIGDDDIIIKSGTIPSIQFSEKIKNALYRPWRTAVIIKLMGRPLAYTFLRARLLQKWALKGPMSLIDLDNNYFIVKFVYEEDMRYVLTSGPWQIAGQYVVTQKWKPGFNAQEEKISHMTAWVRINGLNVEYFRYDVLEKIGNLIGNTIKVDANTMSQARGKFARICIELDLSKPLTPFIEIEGRTFGVVYEGINLVCFECGCYGHGRDTCPIIVQAKQKTADSVEGMEVSITNKNDELQVDSPATLAAVNPAKIHGEWMLMKTRNFKKKILNDSGKGAEISKRNPKNSNDNSGSRFNVLNEEGIIDNGTVIEEFPPDKATASSSNKASKTVAKHAVIPDGKATPPGNKSPTSYGSSPWVFKKPLKDITNSTGTLGGRDINRLGTGSKKLWKNRGGTKPLNFPVVETFGMQVNGADLQDDVRGSFSFNVNGPLTCDPSLAKGGTLLGPEPPDDYNIEPVVGETAEMRDTSDDMEQQSECLEQGKSVTGLEADMLSYHDAPAVFVTGQVQN